MEDNNNGPYEYEKPLKPRQSKRLGFVAGLGLFGVGTVLSSSAFGANLFPANSDSANQTETTDATYEQTGDEVAPVASDEATQVAPQQVRVPLARVEKPKSAAIALPALPKTDFANTSNATQAAGSSTGSGSGAGNVSSATPSAGGGSSSGSNSGPGNVSSSTPSAGGGSGSTSGGEYDHEDHEDHEEHESGDDD